MGGSEIMSQPRAIDDVSRADVEDSRESDTIKYIIKLLEQIRDALVPK